MFDSKGEPGANCLSYDGARQEADETCPHRHRGPFPDISQGIAVRRYVRGQRLPPPALPAPSLALARRRDKTAATVQRCCRSSSQAPAPSLALAGSRGTTATVQYRGRSSSQAPAPFVALAGSRGTLATGQLNRENDYSPVLVPEMYLGRTSIICWAGTSDAVGSSCTKNKSNNAHRESSEGVCLPGERVVWRHGPSADGPPVDRQSPQRMRRSQPFGNQIEQRNDHPLRDVARCETLTGFNPMRPALFLQGKAQAQDRYASQARFLRRSRTESSQ